MPLFAHDQRCAVSSSSGSSAPLARSLLLHELMPCCLLKGVVNAAPLAFIFPALCVLKLQNDKILSVQNTDKLLIVLFGVLVCFCGFIMSVIEMARGVTCSHGEEMSYCVHDNAIPVNSTTSMSNNSTI